MYHCKWWVGIFPNLITRLMRLINFLQDIKDQASNPTCPIDIKSASLLATVFTNQDGSIAQVIYLPISNGE